MATPASVPTLESVALPVVASVVGGFGLGLALELEPSDRTALITVAAVSVALGVAFANAASSTRRALAAIAVSTAASTEITRHALGIHAVVVAVLVWATLLLGVVLWFGDSFALAKSAVIAAVALAFGLPLVAASYDSIGPSGIVQAWAAVVSCLTFAIALARMRQFGSGWQLDIWSPAATLWAFAGVLAFAAAFSSNLVWAALSIFTVSAALLVESILPSKWPERMRPIAVEPVSVLAGVSAAICAATLAVLALLAGKPFGWPVAGDAVVGLAALFVLGRESRSRWSHEIADLRRAALESRVDSLTGLANRRSFDERLDEEIARAVRYEHPLSLLMIDIDDFKVVNDRYGHAAGDEALQALAAAIDRSIRTIDFAARIGGEEFVIILPETPWSGAEVVAQRVLEGVTVGSPTFPTTVSIGVAQLDERYPARDGLLARADEALYSAKRLGKNRVELAR